MINESPDEGIDEATSREKMPDEEARDEVHELQDSEQEEIEDEDEEDEEEEFDEDEDK